MTGAFVGAVFVLFVPDWASGINPALGGLIYGLCLIGMMLVARDGLVGLAAKGLKHLPTGFGTKPTQQSPASSPALGGRRP